MCCSVNGILFNVQVGASFKRESRQETNGSSRPVLLRQSRARDLSTRAADSMHPFGLRREKTYAGSFVLHNNVVDHETRCALRFD